MFAIMKAIEPPLALANGSSAPPFSTLAAAINDLGVIAGSYLDASSNVGAVVGFYLDSSGKFHGFELSPAR